MLERCELLCNKQGQPLLAHGRSGRWAPGGRCWGLRLELVLLGKPVWWHACAAGAAPYGTIHGNVRALPILLKGPSACPPASCIRSYTDSKRVLVPMIHGQALLPDLKITGAGSACCRGPCSTAGKGSAACCWGACALQLAGTAAALLCRPHTCPAVVLACFSCPRLHSHPNSSTPLPQTRVRRC